MTIVNEIDSCLNDEECRRIIIEEFSINELHRIIEKLRFKVQSERSQNIDEKLFELLKERINKKEKENEYDETALLLQYLDSNQLCEESKETLFLIANEYGIIVPKFITELHHQSKRHSKEIQHIQEEEIDKIQTKLDEFETHISKQQRIIEGLQNANKEMKNKFMTIEAKLNSAIDERTRNINKIQDKIKEISNHQEDKERQNGEEINTIKAKLNSAIDERTRNINKIQDKIKEIKNELNAKSLSINQLKQDNEERKSDLSKIQEIYQILTSNIEERFKEILPVVFKHPGVKKLKIDESNEGIFSYLKQQQQNQNQFLPLFYTSDSHDFYEMMNWNSNFNMGSDPAGSFWHEFKFENRIPFSGIKIKSDNCYFPRSFDIKINDSLVYSTTNATELNGAYKEMNIQFKTVTEGDIVRIEQTGPSWDSTGPNNKNTVIFNKIELYSADPQYEEGVFKSLMKKYKTNNPHKIHVIHSSKNFDHNSFYLLNPNTMVCT